MQKQLRKSSLLAQVPEVLKRSRWFCKDSQKILLPLSSCNIYPDTFIGSFAARLDSLCDIDVKVAQTGDFLSMGTAYIAQGGKHMVLRLPGARYFIEIGTGDKVSGHCQRRCPF